MKIITKFARSEGRAFGGDVELRPFFPFTTYLALAGTTLVTRDRRPAAPVIIDNSRSLRSHLSMTTSRERRRSRFRRASRTYARDACDAWHATERRGR